MSIETRLIPSIAKVFPDRINGNDISYLSGFIDEPLSFQIAYKNSENKPGRHLYIEVENDGCQWDEYKVAYVPVINAVTIYPDKYYDCQSSGLYPDILYKRQGNSLVEDGGFYWQKIMFEKGEKYIINAASCWQSLWFTFGGKDKPCKAGKHNITVKFYDSLTEELVAQQSIELEFIDEKLGSQRLLYTNWFHCDCLADTYNVEMFSDRHFQIIESFAKAAADTGMNMILLPAFTPPLDVSVGKERKTAQLVKVTKKGEDYEFDFSLMEKFIKICHRAGITHFEHCHMFSQWGSTSAPNIMGYENGEYKRIFGWETDSHSEEYEAFLKSYFTALVPVLKKTGVGKNILFHISDEPSSKHIDNYKKCREAIMPYIKGYQCGDAISHFDVYKEAGVQTPIISIESPDMSKFVENCDNCWLYYTGESLREGNTNRLISTTAPRNRVVGLIMFYFDMKGFLHWGFNYYYDKLSHGVYDPKVNPCNYGNYPGTSFMVYPDNDGTALKSTRMKVFYEGILDFEALCRFAELTDRKTALDFIEKHLGKLTVSFCPEDDLTLINFRKALNEEIKKYI